MALTAAEIVTAFSNSGFDAASLTAWLARNKLQTDNLILVAKMRNLNAAAAEAAQKLEADRQALQTQIAAKEAQIDLAAK